MLCGRVHATNGRLESPRLESAFHASPAREKKSEKERNVCKYRDSLARNEIKIGERSKRIARSSTIDGERDERERRPWLAVLCAPRKRCL